MSDLVVTVSPVPMKISEIILMLERDGWRQKRVSGSPAFHPSHETWAGHRRWQTERYLETED